MHVAQKSFAHSLPFFSLLFHCFFTLLSFILPFFSFPSSCCFLFAIPLYREGSLFFYFLLSEWRNPSSSTSYSQFYSQTGGIPLLLRLSVLPFFLRLSLITFFFLPPVTYPFLMIPCALTPFSPRPILLQFTLSFFFCSFFLQSFLPPASSIFLLFLSVTPMPPLLDLRSSHPTCTFSVLVSRNKPVARIISCHNTLHMRCAVCLQLMPSLSQLLPAAPRLSSS